MRGELCTVITTDALELGIDIGELDAAVVVTFPGTVASLRQMWGRAGRRGRGLAVYVAGEDALDQFFCRHPEAFLERPVEAAILDHESPLIYRAHLLCAAHEGPLSRGDAEFLGPRWEAHAEILQSAGELRRREDAIASAYVPSRPGSYPAGEVSLRSASPESFAIVDVGSGELLGSTEAARAHSTVHDGAIYMHQGRSYEVHELDLEQPARARVAFQRRLVHAAEGPDRHRDRAAARPPRRARRDAVLRRGQRHRHRARLSAPAPRRPRAGGPDRARAAAHELRHAGAVVRAADRPVGWDLFNDSSAFGLAATVPAEILLGALHATEHAQIAVLPLIAMCDRWDIGGLSTSFHPQTGAPTIFIYDGHPGGIGITRTAYARFEELCEDARRLIAECPCASGCPSCVQSPKCGNLNEPLHKAGALALLARLLVSAAEPVAAGPATGERAAAEPAAPL